MLRKRQSSPRTTWERYIYSKHLKEKAETLLVQPLEPKVNCSILHQKPALKADLHGFPHVFSQSNFHKNSGFSHMFPWFPMVFPWFFPSTPPSKQGISHGFPRFFSSPKTSGWSRRLGPLEHFGSLGVRPFQARFGLRMGDFRHHFMLDFMGLNGTDLIGYIYIYILYIYYYISYIVYIYTYIYILYILYYILYILYIIYYILYIRIYTP